MRGPKLVGYEPASLRWSGDSKDLYFEWRKPGEDEAATYVVGRDGGEPRKLTDAERRTAPPALGQWDRAHRRVLFADAGDIVLLDTVSRARRQLTRTSGPEASPRWARNESAVAFVRDGNLFLLPLEGGGLEQLTDVQPKKREARESDSQKFLKAEEQRLIDHTREAVEKKKKTEEKAKKDALPLFEVQEGQTVSDLALSPDDEHVFLLVTERPDGRAERRHAELRYGVGVYRDDSGANQRRRRAGPAAPGRSESQDRQDRMGGPVVRGQEAGGPALGAGG